MIKCRICNTPLETRHILGEPEPGFVTLQVKSCEKCFTSGGVWAESKDKSKENENDQSSETS